MMSKWFECCFFFVFCLNAVKAGSIPDDLACDKDFAKVGCYKDNRTRAFTHLTNFRGNIDWDNLDAWLRRMACGCASIARKQGSSYFGLQYFGECWTGTKSNMTYDFLGPSLRCMDQNGKQCHEQGGSDDSVICIGKTWSNYVYKLTEVAACEDADVECPKYASQGYCGVYPAVRKHCPKSCDRC